MHTISTMSTGYGTVVTAALTTAAQQCHNTWNSYHMTCMRQVMHALHIVYSMPIQGATEQMCKHLRDFEHPRGQHRPFGHAFGNNINTCRQDLYPANDTTYTAVTRTVRQPEPPTLLQITPAEQASKKKRQANATTSSQQPPPAINPCQWN